MSSYWLFIFMYFVSFIMVMMSSDWFLVWFGLEINMISFLILVYQCNNMYNIECCMKYFFIQSMGSAMLLGLFYLDYIYNYYITFIILSMKIGAGPFFFWFPSVCMGMSWYSCFILMIFQKIMPLMLMMLFMSTIIWLMIVISLIMGAVGSFNQCDLKRFMAFSSIHHLGWIMMSMLLYDNMWLMYLFMYSFILLNVLFMFNYYDLVNVNMMSKCKIKFSLVLGILSMGGIPPMLGFFLKWMVFSSMINMDYIIVLFMLMMSLVMFYVYFRIMYEMIIVGGLFKKFMMLKMQNDLIGMDMISIMGLLLGIFFMFYLL